MLIRQKKNLCTFGGNDKIRGITTNAMSQAWTISIDFSLIIGTDVEFVRRSLNMFAIVPNIQVVRSCFCRLVKYSNATVSIIFNMWKMHCIARCLHLSGNITSYVKEQKNNNGGKTRSVLKIVNGSYSLKALLCFLPVEGSGIWCNSTG